MAIKWRKWVSSFVWMYKKQQITSNRLSSDFFSYLYMFLLLQILNQCQIYWRKTFFFFFSTRNVSSRNIFICYRTITKFTIIMLSFCIHTHIERGNKQNPTTLTTLFQRFDLTEWEINSHSERSISAYKIMNQQYNVTYLIFS